MQWDYGGAFADISLLSPECFLHTSLVSPLLSSSRLDLTPKKKLRLQCLTEDVDSM